MIPYLACALAFLGTLIAARRSIGAGIAACVTVGYAYGILRANFLSTPTYLLFDFAVIGLYIGAGPKIIERISDDERTRQLAAWAAALILWPVVLFFVPGYDPVMQTLGLRGNAFLLPFLLVGAVVLEADLRKLAVWLSVLNLLALAVAIAEFASDVRLFYPLNSATRIIYASGDVAGYTAYRIPATFVNAHAYAGTMVMTLPIIVGAFNRGLRSTWRTLLSYAGIGSAVAGVFLGAARTHAGALIIVAVIVALTGRMTKRSIVGLVAIAAVIGFMVASDVRLQRFMGLLDLDFVHTRVGGSVNDSVMDVISGYPLGNGLAGGGTSIPAFVGSEVKSTAIVENEYGRIAAEQGTVGLVLWVSFILWFITRFPRERGEGWFLGRLAAWVTVCTYLLTAFMGTGLMTSIPQSCLMLLVAGWVAVRRDGTEEVRQQVEVPSAISMRPGWRSALPAK